jgi:hypothetical protein
VRAFAAIVSVAAVGVAAAGCGGDDAATQTPTGEQVSFISPMPGSEVSGPVAVKVNLDGFAINAANVGKAAMAGEGHLHFSMDGGKYDQPKYSGANGELAVKLGTQGKYSPSVMPEITYANLPAGEHTLKVFLANNDHSDAGPVAETTFTVKATPVSFVSPVPGSTVKGPVAVKVNLDGFAISAANVGKAAMAGEGHLHFSMDGGTYDQPKYSGANGDLAVKLGTQGKYSPSVMPQITYSNLPAGEHTLKVFLANNDHSDAGPVAATTFTVE